MDSLTYFYNDKTNQLNYIRDNIAATNYSTDIDNQSANNYAYDSIGNLIQVAADGVSDMTWTVYGKLKKAIGTGFTQQYVYDANNNRIIKIVQFGPIIGKQYFIRDAQGNVLATYTYDGSSLKWAEQDLYGSSRVGLWGWNKTIPTRAMLPQSETDTLTNWYLLGSRYYELTNHLGNVLSVITDKKIGLSLDDATVDHYSAEVLSQQDYYPFGMLEPGRNIRTIPYPYAFNGKRMENVELFTTNIYDYGMRSYDARIGKFYSVDPLTDKYPWYTPYAFAGNTPIQALDLDGAEILPYGTAWFKLIGSGKPKVQLVMNNVPEAFKDLYGRPLFTPSSVGVFPEGKPSGPMFIPANDLPKIPSWEWSQPEPEPQANIGGRYIGKNLKSNKIFSDKASAIASLPQEAHKWIQTFKRDVPIWNAYNNLRTNEKTFNQAITIVNSYHNSIVSYLGAQKATQAFFNNLTNFINNGVLPTLNLNDLMGSLKNGLNIMSIGMDIMKQQNIQIRKSTEEGFKFYQGLLNNFNSLNANYKQLDKKVKFKTQ